MYCGITKGKGRLFILSEDEIFKKQYNITQQATCPVRDSEICYRCAVLKRVVMDVFREEVPEGGGSKVKRSVTPSLIGSMTKP